MPAAPCIQHIEGGDFEKRNASLTGSIHISVGFRPPTGLDPHNAYQLNLRGESMRKTRTPLTQTDHRDL